MATETEVDQTALLDTNTKAINPYWLDPNQPLLVPVNPLHYAAHKYQIILARLDRQAERNPAQFNSGNYIAIMEKLEKLWERINKGETTTDEPNTPTPNDSGAMGGLSGGAPAAVGQAAPAGLDNGVPPQNPFSGARVHSV